MRRNWYSLAAVGFLVFLTLFVVGLALAQSHPYPVMPTYSPLRLSSGYEELASSNWGSSHNMAQIGLGKTPIPQVLDQANIEQIRVQEKIGQLKVGTASYDSDEKTIRAAVAAHKAIIFTEKQEGIAPGRHLLLEIGMPPEQFDALFAQLKQVGHLETVTVHQRDRTEEFRRLHAQRLALKKYQEAMQKLRSAGPKSIDDALKLEQRLQEVEKELQTLAMQLGDFLGKEPYYNIKMTFSEFQVGSHQDPSFTLWQRVGSALAWAIGWWFAIALLGALVLGTVWSIHTLWPGRGISGS